MWWKNEFRRQNSSSIYYVTFLVYFLKMASSVGRDTMNSDVAGLILTLFTIKEKKGVSHVQEPVKLTHLKQQ